MSKRKRDVAFLKPNEPAFISRLKAEAGYKEGPTVDTKREALEIDNEDSDEHDDEQPQVVVVKEGDLTAEEASDAIREKEEGPADLNQRVVFRKPDNAKKEEKVESKKSDSKLEKSKKTSKNKSVLSFTEDDEDNE